MHVGKKSDHIYDRFLYSVHLVFHNMEPSSPTKRFSMQRAVDYLVDEKHFIRDPRYSTNYFAYFTKQIDDSGKFPYLTLHQESPYGYTIMIMYMTKDDNPFVDHYTGRQSCDDEDSAIKFLDELINSGILI